MELVFKDEALKNLQKINKQDLKKVKRKLEDLKSNPLSGKQLHGKFSQQRSLRAWPLRIIYNFDSKKQIIEIITVDYRGNVYK
jgi:addiction module RelE/StbE family toxin